MARLTASSEELIGALDFKPGEIANEGDLMSMVADFAPNEATQRKILVDNSARLFGFR